MSRAKLGAAANHFFDRILPAVTQKHLSDLNNAEVLLGAYRRHTGGPVQALGRPITPEFMLKVAPGKVALQNGLPTLGDAPVAADAANQPLVWMRFAADAKVDDQATIQDLMGDLDTYTQRKFSLAGIDVEMPADVPAPANSAQWAQTIQANRSAIPDNLTTLTEVPAALNSVAKTVSGLKLILSHFFTYDDKGAYYPRWTGAGRNIPQDLSDVYKLNNIRELKLSRDEMFVYMLAPKSLFTTQAAEAHDYREAVIRLDETGDPANPYMPTLVHSVYKRVPDNTPLFHDFIFFESEDGIGLNIPLAVRPKMSAALIQFLLTVPDIPAERARFFQESSHVAEGNPDLLRLSATVTGPVTLPAGVTSLAPESGRVVSIMSPLEKVVEIASLPAMQGLALAGFPYEPNVNLARAAIQYDTFCGKLPAGKQDGANVLVGIIDSGIDGSHPAFNDAAGNSRIVAVWDQQDIAGGSPNSPSKKHPTDHAYDAFVLGRELTGADVRLSKDQALGHGAGHGTHVTGIAAGIEVTDPSGILPKGMAPQAKIVVVNSLGGNNGDIPLALSYIFLKAKELNLPCVVNMSFGGQGDSHDGTDPDERYIAQEMHDASGNYKKGRVIVVSAGNERRQPIHVRRDVAKGNSTVIRFQTRATSRRQTANMWIRSLTSGPKPNLRITVSHAATGWTTGAVTPITTPILLPVPGVGAVQITYGDQDINNGDYNATVLLTAPVGSLLPAEEWSITVANLSDAIELHGWALGGAVFNGLVAADNSVKVGSPGNSPHVITVANVITRVSWPDIDTPATLRSGGGRFLEDFITVNPHALGDLSGSSSPGPLRKCSNLLLDLFFVKLNLERPAIDIAAPGSSIQSALASQVPLTAAAAAAAGAAAVNAPKIAADNRAQMANNISWMMEGTSMAAPVITGIVACMLSAAPDLTLEEVRRLIRAAGSLPAPGATSYKSGAPDPEVWGPGLLNAPKLVK